jgi:hypothetical protein
MCKQLDEFIMPDEPEKQICDARRVPAHSAMVPSNAPKVPGGVYKVPIGLIKVPKGVGRDAETPTTLFPSKYSSFRPILSQYLDISDLALQSIMVYRANAPPLPQAREVQATPVVPLDPATKPVSIGPPRNRKEALMSPWWPGYRAAELLEMKSHELNGTWILKPRSEVPAGAPILRDRWAYDDKLTAGGGQIERFKARLTAMGCFQKAGIDYTDTYASVMATRTFRYLLQLYNSEETHSMEHWDVSTAFIHAPLKEQVFMKQATGHEVKGKEGHVCLLLKALYGTKQAAHAWQKHLSGLLVVEGFLPLILDPATYVWRQEKAFVLIGTHVDDLFVVSNKEGKGNKEKLWKFLSGKLAIKSLGEASWTNAYSA